MSHLHTVSTAHPFWRMRQQLESRGIVFPYCGYLNENILSGIGNALQSKMAIDQTDQKNLTRHFFGICGAGSKRDPLLG